MLLAVVATALAEAPPASCLLGSFQALPSDEGDGAFWSVFEGRLMNDCGREIVAFAGTLLVGGRSTHLQKSVRLWTHRRVIAKGATEVRRFQVPLEPAGSDEDIWLFSAPPSSLTLEWTTTFVLFADGSTAQAPISWPTTGTANDVSVSPRWGTHQAFTGDGR